MIRQEDILKQLQEGADASVLAQQFADALNAAIAQQKQAEAAARQKAEQLETKRQKMQAIVDAVYASVAEYYPAFDLPEEMKKEVNADVVIAAFDEAEKEAEQFLSFMAATPSMRPAKPKSKSNAIEAFLEANGLGNLRR